MRERRKELARLCRCAVERPRWQLVLAVLVSAWTLSWILAQIAGPVSPLDVLREAVEWAGLPAGGLDAAGEWAGRRPRLFAVLAALAGLCWAATTERAQLPALTGWLALLAAGESIGYRNAVHGALIAMAVFLAAVAVLSLSGRRAFVVDRTALVPKDVLRAGATAVTLSAIVPLIAPGLLLVRLFRPYVTRPPRPDPTRAPIPRPRSGTRVTAPVERPVPDR
jgi:hypothetical protein